MSADYNEDSKRCRLETNQHVNRDSGLANGSLSTHPNSSQSRLDVPPTTLSPPILYHMAIAAHESSQVHLQQAFIPSHVAYNPQSGYDPILAASSSHQPYRADPQAATKSFALLLFALDLLNLGLKDSGLSDLEGVAFSLEFAGIAIKVFSAWQNPEIRKSFGQFRVDNLLSDAAEMVDSSFVVAKQQKHMRTKSLQLELLNIRFAFLQGRAKSARRLGRDALDRCDPEMVNHFFALGCLLLELDTAATFSDSATLLDQLEHRAGRSTAVLQWLELIRLRLLFAHRKWDMIVKALERCDELKGSDTWGAYFRLHHLILQTLWLGRTGEDEAVKRTLKEMYLTIDNLSDQEHSAKIRERGAVFEIPVAPGQTISIQSTPLSILYLLPYLVTVVTRRDYLGSTTSCKSLVLPTSMESFKDHARAADMWDTDFCGYHGVDDALSLSRNVRRLRIEVLLEQTAALMYRSDRYGAEETIDMVVKIARDIRVFPPLAPHICLAKAQLGHLFGKDQSAKDHYRAAQILLRDSTELGLVVQLCAISASGRLLGLHSDPGLLHEVTTLSEKCRGSSNANLVACGYFLGSLTDPNRVGSKKKLSSAYEIAQKSNNNVLRCLIFAFTTSVHLYGPAERTMRQLETGRELARLMGGKDRADGVGQLALGLWFAQKLKVHHRREGDVAAHAAASRDQTRHQERLRELRRPAGDQ